jgi:hypothetical protein
VTRFAITWDDEIVKTASNNDAAAVGSGGHCYTEKGSEMMVGAARNDENVNIAQNSVDMME